MRETLTSIAVSPIPTATSNTTTFSLFSGKYLHATSAHLAGPVYSIFKPI